jgi:hypothetical protein
MIKRTLIVFTGIALIIPTIILCFLFVLLFMPLMGLYATFRYIIFGETEIFEGMLDDIMEWTVLFPFKVIEKIFGNDND